MHSSCVYFNVKMVRESLVYAKWQDYEVGEWVTLLCMRVLNFDKLLWVAESFGLILKASKYSDSASDSFPLTWSMAPKFIWLETSSGLSLTASL